MIPTSKAFATAGKVLGPLGIGLTIADTAIQTTRAPNMREVSLSLAKGALDFGVAFASLTAPLVFSNPVGLLVGAGIAGTYLVADYVFDFKGIMRRDTATPQPARREESYSQ